MATILNDATPVLNTSTLVVEVGSLPIYCEEVDVIQRFGSELLDQYANMTGQDTNEQLVARRIWARYQASRDVDDELRGGQYAIPFVGPPYDATIVDITAYLALIRLYELKGTMDWNPDSGKPQHRYHFQRDQAIKKLRGIRMGKPRLNLAMTYKTSLGVHNARVATGALEGHSNDWGYIDPAVTIKDARIEFPDLTTGVDNSDSDDE